MGKAALTVVLRDMLFQADVVLVVRLKLCAASPEAVSQGDKLIRMCPALGKLSANIQG